MSSNDQSDNHRDRGRPVRRAQRAEQANEVIARLGENHPGVHIERLDPQSLHTGNRQLRRRSRSVWRRLEKSIAKFGFIVPIIANAQGRVIDGHARREIAIELGMPTVLVLTVENLSESDRIALTMSLNRLAELAEWDQEAVVLEIDHATLIDPNFEIEDTGFEVAEIDQFRLAADTSGREDLADQDVPEPPGRSVSISGDVWLMGPHELVCDDALDDAVVRALMGDDRAAAVFTDPPYNVPIDGHVSGLGSVRHREFAMASGEMSTAQFEDFLTTFLEGTASVCRDGALLFVCMDWRHLPELHAAAASAGLDQLNLVVWKKTNAGMGSFYRSQHELIGVYKHGTASHRNNVQLGRHGRYRTNVWEYAGVNTFRAGRAEDLAAHPTPKPVQMVADAILDCTAPRDIVLDCFVGSGTTILAAERTGRVARGVELDPAYVDVAVERWQSMTGRDAVHEATGLTFAQMRQARLFVRDRPRPIRKAGDVD